MNEYIYNDKGDTLKLALSLQIYTLTYSLFLNEANISLKINTSLKKKVHCWTRVWRR